jgi:hypothetical protein
MLQKEIMKQANNGQLPLPLVFIIIASLQSVKEKMHHSNGGQS